MHRLTREVRFAIPAEPGPPPGQPHNTYAGYPPYTTLGYYFALGVTVAGQLDPTSQYLLNIKQIDRAVRQAGIPVIERAIRNRSFGAGAGVLLLVYQTLRDAWPPAQLETLSLALTPFLTLSIHAWEHPMVRLSQKFEFSASHRLHNPACTDEQNRAMFGKCNNPHGHGHNYELQVTVRDEPSSAGTVIDIPAFERIVAESVIDRLDHKNLNLEVPEFATLIPSVENIAQVIYRMLKPRFQGQRAHLASVTVWETPKTWCEYSE